MNPLLEKSIDAFAVQKLRIHSNFPDQAAHLNGIFIQAKESGLFSMHLPEKEGGTGSVSDFAHSLARVAKYDLGFSCTMLVQAIAKELLLACGHSASSFGTIAFPIFDPLSIQSGELRVQKKAGSFFVNGRIAGLSCYSIADLVLFFATDELGEGGLYIVPKTESMLATNVESIGLLSFSTHDLTLRDNEALLILGGARATQVFQSVLSRLQGAFVGICFSQMKEAWQLVEDYSKERVQGGRKIADWSAHRMELAQLEQSLSLVESIFISHIREEDGDRTQQLIFVQEQLFAYFSAAISAMGGNGYIKDYPMQKYFRDALVLSSFFGATGPRKLLAKK